MRGEPGIPEVIRQRHGEACGVGGGNRVGKYTYVRVRRALIWCCIHLLRHCSKKLAEATYLECDGGWRLGGC